MVRLASVRPVDKRHLQLQPKNIMTGQQLREALRSGRRVYGTLVASTSPRWVPLVASMPLDFVFIDTEHIAIDREKLSWMCHAYRYAGAAPVVRIPSPDPYSACQVIDGGACGLVAPYIESAAQVRDLVAAVKRRPVKGAKAAAAVAGRETFEPGLQSYVDNYNRPHALIANIESVPAIEALDEILAVDGLDAVLIGPHDLSCSLGRPEEYETPEFESAVTAIFRRARAAGRGAGIHSWMSCEREAAWCAAGANFIIHSSDIIAMRDVITDQINALRQKMGDRAGSGNGDSAVV
jgi:2-keto-3-deoxy-L-rhamnonate aldolase RhmA